jgi:hypothetical protein
VIWEGEGGCLFDEIGNLVDPTERLHMDGQDEPKRSGRRHASDWPHLNGTAIPRAVPSALSSPKSLFLFAFLAFAAVV